MDCSPRKHRSTAIGSAAGVGQLSRHSHVLAFALLWAGLVSAAVFRLDMASREAAIFSAIGHRLLDMTNDGKQGLISSVWWPPFHVLVRLPFVALLKPSLLSLPSVIVSAGFGAALLVFTGYALRMCAVDG